MRYLNSTPTDIVNESINSYNLVNAMVSEPDILPGISKLWRNDITPLTSVLADRGMFSKGLYGGYQDSNYRVVGQNHVQFAIESSHRRVVHLVPGPDGSIFKCEAYPTTPGKYQSVITIWVDIEWLAPKDIFEFGDSRTLGWIHDERIPEVDTNGAFKINFKVVGDQKEAYIDTDLLVNGSEIGVVMNAHEHDFSETAYEKYVFDGWGHSYMTLQRGKYSWSGNARAMQEGMVWTRHNNGTPGFFYKAENTMMKRFGEGWEYFNIFGKGNVTIDGDVLSKTSRGREVMMGSGLLEQGDKAFEFPYHKWSDALLEGILTDIRIKQGFRNTKEVVALLGIQNYNDFQRYMREKRVEAKTEIVWEKSDGGVGIKDTFSFYELNGVRFIPILAEWFSHPDRPKIVLDDGTIMNHWDGVIVSMAPTKDNMPGVELITLKDRFKMGTVAGIDIGGDKMATSVDGSHKHILFQSGVVLRNMDGVARMFRPKKRFR